MAALRSGLAAIARDPDHPLRRRLSGAARDLARRLGSLLAAADAARLRFSSVSTAPGAAAALVPLNPVSLARLLLPGPAAILPTSKTESVA